MKIKHSLFPLVLASTLSLSSNAHTQEYEGLGIEWIKNSLNFTGCSSVYADDLIEGKLDKFNLDIKLDCPNLERKKQSTKNINYNSQNLDNRSQTKIHESEIESPFVSSKDLMKYSSLFEITEEQIGGWDNLYLLASYKCGPKDSCLEYLDKEAQRKGINLALLLGLISQESSFDKEKFADSTQARGLFQITPNTARNLGYSPVDMFNPRKNIDAGIKNMQEAFSWAKRNNYNSTNKELRKAVIRYHMSGPTNISNEYKNNINQLMTEIPIIEIKLKNSRNVWNQSQCKAVFDSPAQKAFSITQERDFIELATKQVVALPTTNKREVKITKACLEELLPNEKFPEYISQFGITIRYGEQCEKEIKNHMFFKTFDNYIIIGDNVDPNLNFGESYTCTGIHYNE